MLFRKKVSLIKLTNINSIILRGIPSERLVTKIARLKTKNICEPVSETACQIHLRITALEVRKNLEKFHFSDRFSRKRNYFWS